MDMALTLLSLVCFLIYEMITEKNTTVTNVQSTERQAETTTKTLTPKLNDNFVEEENAFSVIINYYGFPKRGW